MAFSPTLPITYTDATYLDGTDLQSNFSALIGNDNDLNSRINSIAGGYNQIDLEFTGASLSYSGSTYVSGKPVFLTASAITVTGAAGWRYVVSTDAGVVSIETIPGGEITADTEQYTPEPVYNSTHNGYYSSVNPAKRIIGVCYFDATNITEVISYGNGKNKNDSWWQADQIGTTAALLNSRLQYTGTWNRTRGTDFSIVDNGAGTTDSFGLRITADRPCKLSIRYSLELNGAAGNVYLTVNKNGALYSDICGATGIPSLETTTLTIPMQTGDYITVYHSNLGGASGSAFRGIEVTTV